MSLLRPRSDSASNLCTSSNVQQLEVLVLIPEISAFYAENFAIPPSYLLSPSSFLAGTVVKVVLHCLCAIPKKNIAYVTYEDVHPKL